MRHEFHVTQAFPPGRLGFFVLQNAICHVIRFAEELHRIGFIWCQFQRFSAIELGEQVRFVVVESGLDGHRTA